jgi:imidazolonepropionase-like amidohydrolase
MDELHLYGTPADPDCQTLLLSKENEPMLIYNGVIHPMDAPVIPQGYVRFENGVITDLGAMSQCPEDEDSLDAKGGHVLPGLIDAHCHLGIFGDSLRDEGEDGNEITDPATPQLRALDGINPLDGYFQEARQAGVTTVVVAPGSANAIGGQIVALKTAGCVVDEMVVSAPLAMKFALGENPKMCYRDREETPTTRMATAAVIREELSKAQEYLHKKQKAQADPEEEAPEFDAKLEALCPVVSGEIPAHFHAHRADDIATAVRIAKEFGLRLVLVHATEGHRIADYLGKIGAPVVVGPLMTDRSKPELSHQCLENPAILARQGLTVAICTDHPEIPIPYLALSAALAVKGGMEEEEALAAITKYPAQLLGLGDTLGTLTPGKQADVVVFDRHPFDVSAQTTAVFIGGQAI